MSEFRFKQFTIQQERSAMKVGTDGVLLGAWVNVANKKMALDIGTGTGLLALMLAQKNASLHVDAIEIDQDAFEEAGTNLLNSKFSNQIEIYRSTFEDYPPHKTYDLIVTNPPFYFKNTPPSNPSRKLARFGASYWLNWIKNFPDFLTPNGEIALISPFQDFELIKEHMRSAGLYSKECIYVRPNINKPCHRVLQSYSLNETETIVENELFIELSGRHEYSNEYKSLLEDFLVIF